MTPDEASTTDWSLIFSGVGAGAGVFGVVIGLISLWSLWARAEDKLEERIRDEEDRAELRRELSRYAQGGMNWRNRLVRLNAFLDGPMFQGPWWNWAAFLRCYQIAIIYPALLVLVAWAVAAVDDFGRIPLYLSKIDGQWDRTWRASTVVVASMIVYYIPFIYEKHRQKLLQSILEMIGAVGQIGRWLAENIAQLGILFATLLAVLFIVIFAMDLVGAIAGFVTIASAVVGAMVRGLGGISVGSGYVVGVLGFGTFAVIDGAQNFSALWIFLLLLLPLANTILDWLSWGVTRFLLRRAAQSGGGFLGWGVLIGELIIDLLAAALFLTVLAIILPMVFELWNRVGFAAYINWSQMAEDAYLAPFGAGLLVAGMLLTTFLPTLIHLTYGLYGAVYAVGGDVLGVQHDLAPGKLIPGKVHRLARRIMYLRLSWIPSALLALITMAVLMAPFYFWLDGFALHLREAANWGVDWIWGGAMAAPAS